MVTKKWFDLNFTHVNDTYQSLILSMNILFCILPSSGAVGVLTCIQTLQNSCFISDSQADATIPYGAICFNFYFMACILGS